MERTSIGIILNGVTGRMGYRQHLVRSPARDPGAGWAARPRRQPDLARVDPGGPQRGPARRDRRPARAHLVHHRPGRGARRRPPPDLLRRAGHRPAGGRRSGRRSRPAGTSTPRSHSPKGCPGRWSWPGSPPTGASATAWCRTSCSCPACASSSGWSTAGSSAGSCRCAASSATGVFEGDWQDAQRPSWNYRAEDGGGITVDMFPHWHYVLEQLFGRVTAVTAVTATHIPERVDENGVTYPATADDAAYGIFELAGGVIGADQLLVGGPGVPGRAGRVPGRRHARQRGGRAAGLPHPAPRRHPDAGVEPGPAGHRAVPRPVADRAGQRRPRQRLQGCSGRRSCGTSWTTSRSRGTSWPARAACSSPRPGCAPPGEGRRVEIEEIDR